MKKRYIAAAAGMIAFVLLILGITTTIEKNRSPMQLEDAATLYKNASDATRDLPDVVYRVSRTLETTINFDAFSEQSKVLVSCIGSGSGQMQASIEETLTSGKHKSSISEIYQNGTAYFSINNSKFSCDITAEEFEANLIPIAPLSVQLYSEIIGVNTREEYIVYLSGATLPEDWLKLEGVSITKSSGTAYISYTGMLTKSVYNLEYTKGNAQFYLSVIVEVADAVPDIKAPEKTEHYVKVQNLDGLRMLERASGYLTQVANIQAKNAEYTYFEAFGDRRAQEILVQIKKDAAWSASIDTSIKLSNDSRVGQDSEYSQKEIFKNEIYTLSKQDTPPAQNIEITQEHMQTYCQNILVSTIMLPEYITQCTVNYSNDRIRFTYSANEAFASQVSSNACQTLYQDAALLERISQNNAMQTVTGYLDIDVVSGLPVSSGLQYNGTYTAEGTLYQMQYSAGQIYEIGQP